MPGRDGFNKKALEEAKEIFMREVKDRLPGSLEALQRVKSGLYDPEAVSVLYRFAHTLKGSGQTVGVWDVADPAAEMAVALLLVQNYGVNLDEGIQKFLTERIEEIREFVGDKHIEEISLPETDSANSQGKKILVLDDDPTITELVRKNLEEKGYNVTVCRDYANAEEKMSTFQPDLIVLDIIFPDGDGIEFCRKIRSDPHWQIVPIIFLTVKSKLQDKLAGFATGADDYLCKPFNVEELAARIQAILDRVETFQELVLQDELTHVYNRRYLQRRLSEEIARVNRINGCFSIAIFDIDNFKKINDTYGHSAGDEVLQELVELLINNLRESDIICRFGGDEFVIILTDTDRDEAYAVMERLRCAVSAQPLNLKRSALKIPISISIGVAGVPENGNTAEELLRAADSALYKAKEAGRDCSFLLPEQRVLIVDDSSFIRLEVKRALYGLGMRVLELDNAEKLFLSPKRYQNLSLIILDIHLPGMDGLNALKKIKADAAWSRVPVIILTGRADRATVHEALRLGAIDYFRKPFSREELLKRVRNILWRPHNS